MLEGYKSNCNVVYSSKYHVVWCPKYRRKVLEGDIAKRLEQVLKATCKKYRAEIIALEIMPDHVHLFVQVNPDDSASETTRQIKGYTSRVLRLRYPELLKLPSLWTRSFFAASAGNVSKETIQRYIAAQKGM